MNVNTHFAGKLLAAAIMALPLAAAAEDIDLFVQAMPATPLGAPNVLFIVDNTGNWNTAFTNEKAAIVDTFNNLPLDTFNIGLMFFGDPAVGYVRAAIRPMNAVNQPLYANLVNSLDVNGDVASARTLGRTVSEAYRYLQGEVTVDQTALFSNTKRDYTGNVIGTLASVAVYGLPGNALSSVADTVYDSPLDPASCGGTYIIYIGNNVPSGNVVPDNTARNTYATNELIAAGGDATTIPLAFTSHQANIADEWARFMQQSMGVKFYTVDVNPTPMPGGHSGGMGNSALLESMATVSGGKYFRVRSDVGGGSEISGALNVIFSEIQSVNSAFASVSLPVSVNTQGTYLNQVYVGLFRPDTDALPRWPGNLKQYKLGIVNNELRTLDADDQSAINSVTGFITECARSFWTPSATDDYWFFRPQGNCLAVPDSASSNYPDGSIVEKGAQAYQLRSSTTRTVKTCSPAFASCSTLTDFNTANTAITQALLGAATSAERDQLIDWQRGLDLQDEYPNGVTTTEMRPSAHGDVLHSRPVAINYGTDAAPEVVVFYGGNDGVLRAVNGNRTDPVGAAAAGNEIWTFVAPEFYGQIKRLHDNNLPISFSGALTPPVRAPKPYGFDGPITAYQDASNIWIYPAMRRGGRFLHAFDVTGINANPGGVTLKWKRGCPNQGDDVGCSSGLSGIGQTWSAPQVIKTNGYTSGGVAAPMLIFGGGYNACEDTDPHTCTAAAKGRAVYVLDADDGSLVRNFATDRPVVGDVFVVPDGTTGLARYAYAVDTGGNIYRISGSSANVPFGTALPSTWTITKIASLGCDSAGATSPSASCQMNRKFLFAPDIVEKDGVYHLLIGSGDREKPLMAFTAAYNVNNYFFMVKDNPASASWLGDETATCGSAVICLDSLAFIENDGADPDAADLATMKGWALDLRDHEQVVTSSITVFGTTTFSTHTPTVPVANACTSNLGTARVYNVRFANAAAANGTNNRDEEIAGGGLPPSPVAGMVELDDGTVVPFVIGADSDSPLESSLPSSPSTGTQPKSLTYWLIDQ